MMGPDSFDICILSFERNPQHTRVIRLKSLISAVWSWDNHVKFELHKVNLSPQEWSALPDGVAPLIDRTTKLPDLKEMDEIWPGGFPVGSPAFIVKLKSGVFLLPLILTDYDVCSLLLQTHLHVGRTAKILVLDFRISTKVRKSTVFSRFTISTPLQSSRRCWIV